jgi:poly-gamma-glutamate synthesis protein (capsule biosynthesis protein)
MKHGKKHLRAWVKILIATAVLTVLGFSGYSIYRKYGDSQQAASSSVQETASASPSEEPVTTSASMFMVGDGLLHTTLDAAADDGNGGYDFTKLLGRIGAIAEPYDLEYYNQETILAGDEYGIHGYPTFNGPRAFGDTMCSYGFNLVSLANNHSLDMGAAGTIASTEYWKSKTNTVSSGTYTSQADRDAITIHEVNGIKYAFFSWTYGMNGFENPSDQPYLVACYDGHTDEMLNQITEAKKQADVVIVAMHWGTEYQTEPSEEQQELAQQLSDAGADIIIGNHPHCIQPIQKLNDHTICFYALGNLCAAQYGLSRVEMMGALTIEKTVYKGETTIAIKDVKADLMYCYADASFSDNEVVPFSQMTDDTYTTDKGGVTLDHNAVYNQYVGIITEMDPEVQVGGF